ncbi:MAG: GtrA family protein [Novosphingobium sp.]
MLRRARDLILLRYLAASVFALGVDVATFLTLLSLGALAAPASAAGYSLGILAHWLASSRAVFTAGVAARGPERTRQKAQFVMSALAGLALTTAIVGAGSALGLDPRLAKVLAVCASFVLTWLLREKIVFRASVSP